MEVSGRVMEAKDPDVAKTYDVNVHELLVDVMARDTRYEDGDLRRPEHATGFYYTAAVVGGEDWGRTAKHHPALPRLAGASVQDGTIIWAATHPANAALPTIDSVVWTSDLDVTQEELGEIARVKVSGGEAGKRYDLTARITLSNSLVVDVTVVIPVEHL